MELEQLEAFAFGEDRDRAVDQLVPGTDEHFFFRCLLHQHRGELDRVPPLVERWVARLGRTSRVEQIEARQRLLAFDPEHPEATFSALADALGVRFDHQRRSGDGEASHPERLDPELISRRAFEDEARRLRGEAAHELIRELDLLLDGELAPEVRRQLLDRVRWPTHRRLLDHVLADLEHSGLSTFGDLEVHRRLTLEQLEALAERRPELLESARFVGAWLERLSPNPDVDLEADLEARRRHLERLWAFACELSAAFASLQAHLLYHLLDDDRRRGVYDLDRLHRYLELPRRGSLGKPSTLRGGSATEEAVDLGASYRDRTSLLPIGDDQELLRESLMHHFAAGREPGDFAGLVEDGQLRTLQAEAMLLAGDAARDRWAAQIGGPEAFGELRDRVELRLTPNNRVHHRVDEPVALEVDLKNIGAVLVKVFQINTESYLASVGREVDLSVDLDGMVAAEEWTIRVDAPPIQRVHRRIELEGLQRPGVFIVELIGGGVASRALIRKGGLRLVDRPGSAGQVITVFDDEGQHLPEATLRLGSHEYEADEDGVIRVPYATGLGTVQAILCHRGLAVAAPLERLDERYELEAAMLLDREQLLGGKQATVLIRPLLKVQGAKVSLGLLERPTVRVAMTDLDGVDSEVELPVELARARELEVRFEVPWRLASLEISLAATVRSVTEQREVELEALAGRVEVHSRAGEAAIEDTHFALTGGGLLALALGRNGERRAGRPLVLRARHQQVDAVISTTLQTDGDGRVRLGALSGLKQLEARGPGGVTRRLTPPSPWAAYPTVIHALEGEEIRLPLPGDAGADEVVLFEQRRGVLRRQVRDEIEVAEGELILKGLERGDYQLALLRRGTTITLRVARGEVVRGWAVSSGRTLELGRRRRLVLRGVEIDDDALTVRLANLRPGRARVHLIATRFRSFDQDRWLGLDHEWLRARLSARQRSEYLSERDIGDEYRYVLERQDAERSAGCMASRPGLLINPWAVGEVEIEREEAAAGEDWTVASKRERALKKSKVAYQAMGGERGDAPSAAAPPTFDFLPATSVILSNLRPNEAGVVQVPRGALGGAWSVRVIALDGHDQIQWDQGLSGGLVEVILPRDLRLGRALDPAQAYCEREEVLTLGAGQELTLGAGGEVELCAYESLRQAFDLLSTLCPDPQLDDFRFLVDWPSLDEETKRKRYAERACHELHLFLYFKDRPFFDEVVAPALRCKLEKTLFDRFLLGEDLSASGEVPRWERLNLFERILLAWRHEEEREPTARRLEELLEARREGESSGDLERQGRVFSAALRGGRSLEDGGGGAPPPGGGPAPSGFGGNIGLGAADELAPEPLAAFAALDVVDDEFEVLEEEAEAYAEAETDFDDRARDRIRRLYRGLGATQRWAESNYDRRFPREPGPGLIEASDFWLDLARGEPGRPVLSRHFPLVHRHRAEALLALAVLDLPFEAEGVELERAAGEVRLRAGGPAVVFARTISAAEPADSGAPLLISQRYLEQNDQVDERTGGRRRREVERFECQQVYQREVVLTNPTPEPQRIDLLLQLPEGSISTDGAVATRSRRLRLEPFGVERLEQRFYFPAPGCFVHLPAQASRDGQLLIAGPRATLEVVERLVEDDGESWEWVSQRAELPRLLRFLDEESLEGLDLSSMAWRMRDGEVFAAVVDRLRRRKRFDPTIWSYGLAQGDLRAVRQWLEHDDGPLRRCGRWLDSPLISFDEVGRGWSEHLEFAPLINARAHRLGSRRRLLNAELEAQYRGLLERLCEQAEPGPRERLQVTSFLLLQDRITEARALLSRVDREARGHHLQWDYLTACLALHEGDGERARAAAAAHADEGHPRWRELFREVLSIVDEAEGAAGAAPADADDLAGEQARLAATAPNLELELDGDDLVLTARHLRRCWVSYFPMNIELLFSRQPFMQQQAERFALIEPHRRQEVLFEGDEAERRLAVPQDYRSRDVVIEARAGGLRSVEARFANDLRVVLVSEYGQVLVQQRSTGRPLPRTYVKVYARSQGGEVRFYKDGYTDLRGRFDYATLSNDALELVERFALLILDDHHGALVLEAAAPTR